MIACRVKVKRLIRRRRRNSGRLAIMKMKRLMTGILAGAFGLMLLAPSSYAWESRVERRAQIWEARQAARRHRAEMASRDGYYNGGYYYPRAYTWAPAPAYAYGYRYHRYHRWHHDDDD